jgi:hypothetical protein
MILGLFASSAGRLRAVISLILGIAVNMTAIRRRGFSNVGARFARDNGIRVTEPTEEVEVLGTASLLFTSMGAAPCVGEPESESVNIESGNVRDV